MGTLIKNKAALTLSFSKEMNGPLTQAIEKAVTKAFAEALKKNEVLTKANFAEALEENEVLTKASFAEALEENGVLTKLGQLRGGARKEQGAHRAEHQAHHAGRARAEPALQTGY